MDPMEMDYYGTQHDGSFAYMEDFSMPNINTFDSRQQSQSYVSEPKRMRNKDAYYDGGRKRGRTGKWVDPNKRKRSKIDPSPSSSLRNDPCTDEKLPKVLQELCTPMKCKLCECLIGSASSIKDHYNGKKHKVNVRKWFLVHPEHQGEACRDYFAPQPKITDPKKLYCKHCDLMLSSEQQVESHFMGKRHHNVMKRRTPKNANINTVRKRRERLPKGATKGKRGRGSGSPEKRVGKGSSLLKNCFCKTCMVACPSEITFREHMSGSKHKKKVLSRKLQTSYATKNKDMEEGSNGGENAAATSDLSIYRTPTGNYYCSTCNVTVNSPTQFVQHSESKKHKSKAVFPVLQLPTKE